MAVVNMRLNTSDLEAGITSLRRKFPRAVKRSLKRTGTAVRTIMVKSMGADTGLSAKRIKKEVRVNELGDTGVQIEVTGNRIPLIEFKARGDESVRGQPKPRRGRGVAYRLPGGRGRAPDAFIATMPSGHRGVFKRKPGARTRQRAQGRSSLPLIQLHGPSLVRVFEKFLPLGAERGREALVKNLRSEIAFAQKR